MREKIKIIAAMALSFGLVYRVFNFSQPSEIVERIREDKFVSEKLAWVVSLFSSRSYAKEAHEVEFYYKGKRLKVITDVDKLSDAEKRFIFLMINEARKKYRSKE